VLFSLMVSDITAGIKLIHNDRTIGQQPDWMKSGEILNCLMSQWTGTLWTNTSVWMKIMFRHFFKVNYYSVSVADTVPVACNVMIHTTTAQRQLFKHNNGGVLHGFWVIICNWREVIVAACPPVARSTSRWQESERMSVIWTSPNYDIWNFRGQRIGAV